MEDQAQQWHSSNPPAKQESLEDNNKSEPDRIEPVRSRWTPKPEQILILESIFNSGMVNPPKDETVRIRKLLEKFGSVGDANVFYWFQNRRSRSRRRQRQLQAASLGGGGGGEHGGSQKTTAEGCFGGGSGGDGIQYGGGGACSSSSGFLGLISNISNNNNGNNNNNNNMLNCMNIAISTSGCSSSNSGVMESLGCVDHHDIFSFPSQMDHPGIIEQASSVCSSTLVNPSDSLNFHPYQPGMSFL
ncbi:homeodomain transcription factor [Lithospermum erythrorhizon]|uniref:Protein WUSCHEL n=1 Tax=Lithospermum erythrorhizon TaxID=34254 RepID=A0AAV3RDK7_LITER